MTSMHKTTGNLHEPESKHVPMIATISFQALAINASASNSRVDTGWLMAQACAGAFRADADRLAWRKDKPDDPGSGVPR